MATQSLNRGAMFRLRMTLIAALLGTLVGFCGGVKWEVRNDPPAVRQPFVQDFLPAAIGLQVGYTQWRYLHVNTGPFTSPWAPAEWLVQVVHDPAAAPWLVLFENRLHWIWAYTASGALLFGALVLRLTARRSPADAAGTTTDHLRSSVPRPWD